MADNNIETNTNMDIKVEARRYSLLDTPQKRRVRQVISDSLTSDVRDECPGLVILVLSFDEYDVMQAALKERANRKRKINTISNLMDRQANSNVTLKYLTLNIESIPNRQ